MFESGFKDIDDVFWSEAGRTAELDWTKRSSWLVLLKKYGRAVTLVYFGSHLCNSRYENPLCTTANQRWGATVYTI
jgi:hypothetical protein